MSIDTADLYEEMQESFGVGDSARFEKQFLRALNRVSIDLALIGLTQAAITTSVTDLSLDAKYRPVYVEGIKLYLQGNREWAKESDEEAARKYMVETGKAQVKYFEDNDPYVGSETEDD